MKNKIQEKCKWFSDFGFDEDDVKPLIETHYSYELNIDFLDFENSKETIFKGLDLLIRNGFEKDETLLNIFFDSLGVMFFGADFEEKVNDLKAALGEDWVEIIIKEFNEEGWSESFASMDLLVEDERIKANEKLKEKYKDYTFEF